MWKKFNFLCTIIISGTVGAFLGYSIYVCWEHKTQRDLDVLTSFPWYSGIQLFGIAAAVEGEMVCREMAFYISREG